MKKRRLSIHHMLPGLSLAFTLFIFAPADLYLVSQARGEQFWFPLSMLVRWLVIFAAAAFVLVTLLVRLLPKKASAAFSAAVYAASILAHLQGSVLLLDYGTLDGRQIDWSAYRVPYLLDALLWIAVIGLFVYLMLRFGPGFRRVAETAAWVLLGIQVLSLSFQLVSDPGRWENEKERYLSREGLFTVSEQNNTIVFILDCFDSELFENLYRDDPEQIGELCADFTFYPDTVGGATRTKYAVPFILTGTTNLEVRSYRDYLSDSFAESPLIRELASGKYDTGFYTSPSIVDMSRDDAIGNIRSGTSLSLSKRGLTTAFMKLVAFRCAPSVLSRFFWMYSGDFEKYKSSVIESAYAMEDAGFYQELTGRRLSVSAGRDCFRFIHLNGAHEPYTLDENGRRVQESDESRQAIGSLRIVAEYLDQMKVLGVYEDATILVMADHGYRMYHYYEQTPLFMVKLAGSAHPFEVSDLPLSFASLPEMLASALRGGLDSLEPYRAESPRYFYIQNQADDVSIITELAVEGPALSSGIEKTGARYYEDTKPDGDE